ncbi:VOC family protein [Nakamurella flavida]|uniref:VOC family protein n=1 Tax=Nakamurella flavida TaxID=363630 RepID=A0A939C3I5_9ACTN|nr:VOC family protein [Nakamurella flavida]MBM9477690.1 VOC family protein [Nakamurella flavida]MDP9779242.1 PhnB protein [Nakamurella flavida]
MSITTAVHLNFRRQAQEALTFYRSVFGGELTLATYTQAQMPVADDEGDLIAWGEVRSSDGFHVMAYDVPAARAHDAGIDPVFVSVRGNDEKETRRYWAGLADGGTIKADLGPSGWAPLYGMVTDRFGITWILDVTAPWAG